MATLVDLVVRDLLAAGHAPTEDGKATYLLNEKDGKLVRVRWTDTAPGARKVMAKDVRSGSTAVYLVWNSAANEEAGLKREEVIFYVDSMNSLAAVKLSPTNNKWEPLDLSSVLSRTVAAGGQLSGLVTPDAGLVVFENATGEFQGLLVSNDCSRFQPLGNIPAKPLPGSPHHILPSKEKLSLFYVDANRHIRHTALDTTKNEWDELELNDAHFADDISKLTVLPVEKDGTFEVFVISGSKVEMINVQGRTELGTVQDGKFVRPSSAECIIMINGNNYGNIWVGGGGGYGYGGWSMWQGRGW